MVVRKKPYSCISENPGFTLIELLIVVAIIAILAAIAIPNYLEAQVRAKVAKVVSEFRTLGTGIEAYMVDNQVYPADYWPYMHGCLTMPPGESNPWNLHVTLGCLTTPVSYLSTLPVNDPFNDRGDMPGTSGMYYYVNDAEQEYWRRGCGTQGGERFERQYKPRCFGDRWYFWLLKSYGPDRQVEWWDWPPGVGENVYDPSNGTMSRGDIFRIGP